MCVCPRLAVWTEPCCAPAILYRGHIGGDTTLALRAVAALRVIMDEGAAVYRPAGPNG